MTAGATTAGRAEINIQPHNIEEAVQHMSSFSFLLLILISQKKVWNGRLVGTDKFSD
jgi:hypothetical protein